MDARKAALIAELNSRGQDRVGFRDDEGKYTHKLERVCKCGHTKGQHLAERPYPMEDESMCPRFRLDRKASK